MNLHQCFICVILALLSLAIVAGSVPLAPETEARLRASGQWDQIKDAVRQARSLGVDAPTTRPINVRQFVNTDIDLHVLTILVDFSDKPANYSLYPTSHYEEMLYSQGVWSTGSMRDYYRENSYNQIDIVGEAAGWYRMPQPYSYYVGTNYGMGSYPNNSQKLTEDAVAAADPFVDFSQYDDDQDGYVDGLFIVHAGVGAEQSGSHNDIWSHAWVTHAPIYVDGVTVHNYSTEPENGNIGVFSHELGHALFGLPDLYDYDYDSNGTGNWSLMSGGSWGGGGTRPVHLDAYSKTLCGLATGTNVTANLTHVAFPQVETNNVVYRLWSDGAYGPQYFLVENRQRVGFDLSLPASGLLIYHIEEEDGSNNHQWYPGYTSNGHYLVAVEQADGLWQLEHNTNGGDGGDPWPGTTNKHEFDVSSTPDTKNYAFQPTMVAIGNISNSADTMYADLSVTIYVPNVNITTSPVAPPVVIPVNGGSFQYNAQLSNPGTIPESVQVWNRLRTGNTFFQIFGPRPLTVPGGANLNRTVTQYVSGNIPAGSYSFVSYVGTYPGIISDSSFFNVTKNALADGGPWIGASYAEGDLFDEYPTSDVRAQHAAPLQPAQFALQGAFPNPFNPTTAIRFDLPDVSPVTLTVYDINGRIVRAMHASPLQSGSQEITFDGSNLASGIYLYRLEAGSYTAAGGKMVLLK
ncbi:MAG: M6 family metalloprotease domain-containing protein [bacterium]|nr:M6 family metalloprotease domain-containing protein [bacterium]